MEFDRSFRFVNAHLQRRLLDLVAAAGVAHRIADNGTLHYFSMDAVTVENELVGSIRDSLFPEWGIFTVEGCDMAPLDEETAKYRDYMQRHEIPFVEEIHDKERWFLIPRPHDSFEWKV